MRMFLGGLLSTAFMMSSTFAATQSASPLPAGKPAGVKEAAFLGPNLLLVLISAGIIVGGISMAASNSGGNNGVTTPSTTTTSTSVLP